MTILTQLRAKIAHWRSGGNTWKMSALNVARLYENLALNGTPADGHEESDLTRFARTAESWMTDRPGDIGEVLAMHTRLLVDGLLELWTKELDGADTPLNGDYVPYVLADLCALGRVAPPPAVVRKMEHV